LKVWRLIGRIGRADLARTLLAVLHNHFDPLAPADRSEDLFVSSTLIAFEQPAKRES